MTNTHDDVSFLQSSTHGGVRFTLAILHNVDTIDKVQRFNHSCDRSTHTSQSVEPSPVATKFHTGFVMRYSNNNTALDELFVVACLGFIRCVRLAWCNRAIVGASVVFLVLSYGGSCVCQLAVQYLSFHQPNQFLKKQYNSEDDLFMVYLKNALFYCSFKGWYYWSNLLYRSRHHHFYHRYFHFHFHCHCHHFYHHRHERHEQPSFCPDLPHNPVAFW